MAATLADVARLSATSRSTASRALNNDSRISPSTVERVRLVAEALGYRPNLAARSLSTGRSGILGLVLPTGQLTGDPYGSQVVSAVTAAAMHADHAVMLWLSHERPGPAVEHVLNSGLVDGLVVSIVAQDDPWVSGLLESGLPCVTIGRHSARPDLSYATVDNVGGTRELMTHLLAQGYSRIAAIRGPVGNADADERFGAYVEALGGLRSVDANLVVRGAYDFDGGYAACQAVLRHRPDCVVAANDHAALGAMQAIRDAGLRVTDDVAVSGWYDMSALRPQAHGLTTVAHDVEAVGQEAVSILGELLAGDRGPIQRVLPARLVVRASTCRGASAPSEVRRDAAASAGGAMTG